MEFSFSRDNLGALINDSLIKMSELRNESIIEKNQSLRRNQDYFFLNVNLASYVKELLANNDVLRSLAISLSKQVRANTYLLYYDPVQDEQINLVNKEFLKTLDRFTLSVLPAELLDESKHHLMQSLKYLDTYGMQKEDQLKYYSSILPYIGAVRNELDNYAGNKIINLLGNNCGNCMIDEFTMGVMRYAAGQSRETDYVNTAKRLGFKKIIAFTQISSKWNFISALGSNNVYERVLEEENMPGIISFLSKAYAKYGSIITKVLTENIYRADSTKDEIELKKNEILKSDPFFNKIHNANLEMPLFYSEKKNHLIITDNFLTNLITEPDFTFSNELKKDLTHLYASNKDTDFILKRLNDLYRTNKDTDFILKRLNELLGEKLVYADISNLSNHSLIKKVF